MSCRVLIVLIVLVALIGAFATAPGCKPAEEPPRRHGAASAVIIAADAGGSGGPGAAPGGVRVTERIALPPAKTEEVAAGAPPLIGGVRPHAPASDVEPAPGAAGAPDVAAAAPATPDTQAAAPIDGAVADSGPETTGTFATRPEDLPADLVAALAADTPASARDEARRLNKLGLESHKQLALDAAIGHYREGLRGAPAFPYARYNLACALALLKRNDEALFHLAVLRHLVAAKSDNVSQERLEAARIDTDFELLRDDPRFRALTGATEIHVSWVAGVADAGKKEAQRLAKVLREARWLAKIAPRPWQTPIAGDVIRVRADDAVAEAAAAAIARLLQDAAVEASGHAWPIEIGAPLPPEAPPLVVVVTLGQTQP